jgi:hypothetical protein
MIRRRAAVKRSGDAQLLRNHDAHLMQAIARTGSSKGSGY